MCSPRSCRSLAAAASALARSGHTHPESVRRGELNGGSKLTSAIAIDIWNSSESHAVVASRYGISRACAIDVRSGRTWSHATTGQPGPSKPSAPSVEVPAVAVRQVCRQSHLEKSKRPLHIRQNESSLGGRRSVRVQRGSAKRAVPRGTRPDSNRRRGERTSTRHLFYFDSRMKKLA